MKINPDISSGNFDAFLSLAVVTISFLCYHFITSSNNFKKSFDKKSSNKKRKIKIIVLQRLTGFLFYGIIPVFMIQLYFENSVHAYGMNTDHMLTSIRWICIISPVIIIMNYLNAGSKDNLTMYPQIRVKNWNSGLIILSTLSWISYLFAYEFMFRGMFLFSMFYSYGTVMAVLINTSIYALVHLPKGIKETIGAIPLGIILCILTLKTESIVIAVTIHIVMALSNEWFSLAAHPKMKIKKRK